MVSATTWALAPGYRVVTCIVGGTICGYWATGRLIGCNEAYYDRNKGDNVCENRSVNKKL